MTDRDRRKWNPIQIVGEISSKIIEWKFQADTTKSSGLQGARYGIVAFAKSSDGKFVDCMLAIYKLDFKLAPTLVSKERSMLWGFYKYCTLERAEIDKSLSKDEIEKFQNYFRFKALSEFKKEGVIDQISYTNNNEATEEEKKEI